MDAAARPARLAPAIAVLFSAHAVGVVVPLLTLPWLARVLGPAAWAPVLIAQGLANWATLVLEFGFDLAGARDVAQATSEAELARTAAAIQRARLLLTPFVSLCVVGVAAIVMPGDWRLIAGTVAFVVARGLSPYWFYQGKQKVRAAALLDALSKVIPAAAVFVMVRGADDGWWVLALQALGAAVSTSVLTWRMHGEHALPRVTTGEAFAALRGAVPLFAARAAAGMYLQANTMILSFFAPPVAVATYGGAERIVRSSINFLTPLTQALFPRMSRLVRTAPDEAHRELRRILVILVGLAIVGAGAMALLGTPIIALLLGASYAASADVLRVLVLAIPLVTAGTVLGIYWALPWHREQLFLWSIVLGGVVNIVTALLLVPNGQAMGMATAVIAAECSVTLVLVTAFVREPRHAAPERR